MLRRGEVLYRRLAVLAVVWSSGFVQPQGGWAVTRDAFKAPSTMSGAVEPYDWEEEEKLSTILLDIVPSRDGWRAQGWRKSQGAPKSNGPATRPSSEKKRSASEKKEAAQPKPTPVTARRVVHPPNIPDWRPPQPEQLSGAAKVSDQAETVAPKQAAPAPALRFVDEVIEESASTSPSGQPAGKSASPRQVARATPLPRSTPPDITPLNRQQIQLRNKIRRVLAHYYNRPLNTADRGPWELMHAMLSFEVHSRVLQGGPNGKPITAVGWLCFNQPCRKRSLMYINKDDELRVRVGPGLQGHHGQLLALLAQARVKSDYPMKVDDADLTIADLIEMEKKTCYPRTELTFKLIGLMHYLDSESTLAE